jgi:hypothetical protein
MLLRELDVVELLTVALVLLVAVVVGSCYAVV